MPHIDDDVLASLDAWCRAADYLTVGQIYLLDNPLLREPLEPAHIKPRLLGHVGTVPGLNLVYAHANRVICDRGLQALYIAGPGHGGPGMVASAWLDGTYTEHYPDIRRDDDGCPVSGIRADLLARRDRARAHTREHGEDAPEITGWRWKP